MCQEYVSRRPSDRPLGNNRRKRYIGMHVTFVAIFLCAPCAFGADRLAILPPVVRLHGPHARQSVVVERFDTANALGVVVDEVHWESSNEQIVRIDHGVAVPQGNGVAQLRVTTPLGSAETTVEVEAFDQPAPWEFRRHVLPVLSRLGCNMGACHGALAGKGGFRLSLRGYHPEGDWISMTREARGRRIELAAPSESLLLAKPTGAIPHQGGLRLDTQSPEYRLLLEWIEQGARGPQPNEPKLDRLEVFPATLRLERDAVQPLLVSAHYADGRVEDVTRWAKFTSSDETVARVDERGEVHVASSGDTAIVVWFSSQIALSRIVVPFESPTPRGAPLPLANFIDARVAERLTTLQIDPSPRCTDAEFLRRATLDTIGRLPTMSEVTAWQADRRADKRVRLIDSLLAREEFVDYWTYKFSDLFLISGRRLRPAAVDAYYGWLRNHIANNSPWDQLAREVVTARGSSIDQGATNFYALHQDPETMTENVCQAFLGLSIGCAKCHNHPLEKWTNQQYYAMANFFSRVRAKGWGGEPRNGDGVRTLLITSQGELIQPLSGQAQIPTPLDGNPLDENQTGDRREYLADWLVARENPYFARAIANRIWANFLGRGVVEPVDDLRLSNPARNEPLLADLSRYLAEQGFDLRALMRAILVSETYQRSSEPNLSNQADRYYFSRYYPRRLSAEVLLDAIAQVTNVPSRFTQIEYDGHDYQDTDAYRLGTRAVELHDSAIASGFLRTFGRNERDITCECERSNTPSMIQVLHLHNGTTINDRLHDPQGIASQWAKSTRSNEQIIRDAYLVTLAREPNASELQRVTNELGDVGDPERAARIEDLFWALLSSREFLFNH